MAVPMGFNNTADIYRTGRAPPSAPDVAGVPIHLCPSVAYGNNTDGARLIWTHLISMEADVDVRDPYDVPVAAGIQDTLYVPDKNGTPFIVQFIEIRGYDTPHEHK